MRPVGRRIVPAIDGPGIRAQIAAMTNNPEPLPQEAPEDPRPEAPAAPAARPGPVARRLLRAADRAALATELADRTGGNGAPWPYASLVLLACDHDAAPLLLMSDLSEHARNIAADPRLSLLIDGTAGRVDPLTGPRVSLLGRAEKTTEPRLKARFVARHPSASLYADFADFHLYRVTVTRAHFVAGFGRIHWIDAADLLPAAESVGSLASEESALIERLLERHADLGDRLARQATGRAAGGWRITGIDPEGIDLRRKGTVARIDFPAPAGDGDSVMRAIEELLQKQAGRQKK
jgi:heme oxygenase (biliverdin-IX-beta and delta-forming)